MESGAVRKGITQAQYNEDAYQIIWVDILIISSILGLVFQSWLTFGTCVIGLVFSLNVPILNVLMSVVLSVGWALIGYLASLYLFTQNAGFVIGGIAFLCGIGAHFGAIEWSRDVSDPGDRNIGFKRRSRQLSESPRLDTTIKQASTSASEETKRRPAITETARDDVRSIEEASNEPVTIVRRRASPALKCLTSFFAVIAIMLFCMVGWVGLAHLLKSYVDDPGAGAAVSLLISTVVALVLCITTLKLIYRRGV